MYKSEITFVNIKPASKSEQNSHKPEQSSFKSERISSKSSDDSEDETCESPNDVVSASSSSANRGGTNDSAYASDRHSNEKPFQSNKSQVERKMSLSSEFSSPDIYGDKEVVSRNSLPGNTFERPHSTEFRKTNHKLSSSDDHINKFAPFANFDDILDGRVSNQSHSSKNFFIERPSSADSNISKLSEPSIKVSNPKIRRSLPKIPGAVAADVEERKKRISAEVIKNATMRRHKHSQQRIVPLKSEKNSKTTSKSFSKSYSVEDNRNYNPQNISNRELNYDSDESEFAKEIQLDSRGPTPLRPELDEFYESQSRRNSQQDTPVSQHDTPNSYERSSDDDCPPSEYKPYCMDDLQNENYPFSYITQSYGDLSSMKHNNNIYSSQPNINQFTIYDEAQPQFAQKRTLSTESLSRMIDIANSNPRNYSYGTNTASSGTNANLDFKQLAKWGILEPSKDEIISKIHRPLPIQGNKPINTSPDILVLNPSLHFLLQFCDLSRVNLEQSHDSNFKNNYGIHVFECVFSKSNNIKSRRPIFRDPSSKKTVIGRPKGAFQPVSTINDELNNSNILSMIAVDCVDENSASAKSGLIFEGDYIVEINSKITLNANPASVYDEICRSGDRLELVVCRPSIADSRRRLSSSMQDLSFAPGKEFERLKLKYSAMKTDLEKNMDLIADLKLDIKDRDERIEDLEKVLTHKENKLHSIEKIARKREEEANKWKCDINNKNIEIGRLKYESKQRDERIAQLRKLLIQQTEIMQIQKHRHNKSSGGSSAESEHGSAV